MSSRGWPAHGRRHRTWPLADPKATPGITLNPWARSGGNSAALSAPSGSSDRVGRVRALALVILTCALGVAGVGLSDAAAVLVALFALIGQCLSITQLVGQTHRLLAMPAAYRARMTAAHLTVAHAVAAIAPAMAGGLLQQVAVAEAYLVLASSFAATGLLLLCVPGLGHFLRQDHRDVEGWYERQYPEAFNRL